MIRPMVGPNGRPMVGPNGRPMIGPTVFRPMEGPDCISGYTIICSGKVKEFSYYFWFFP